MTVVVMTQVLYVPFASRHGKRVPDRLSLLHLIPGRKGHRLPAMLAPTALVCREVGIELPGGLLMTDVSIDRGGGVVLAATLSLPARTPALAMVGLHGASGGTRADPLLARLHALLPAAGVAALTFDRRGEGESTGHPSLGDFETQAKDAAALAAWLRALPEVTEVGAFGLSQGAWVAPLALRRADFRFLRFGCCLRGHAWPPR